MKAVVRVGLGLDSHRFVVGRRLVLGGVTIPFRLGLDGHSDADALTHAITDALLGACGLGDLGEHFPATDDRFKDCCSLKLLEHSAAMARERGFRVVNVDSVIMAEQPRLADYRDSMRRELARTLGLEQDAVNVKLKSAEGLGTLGRLEGLAAQAVVLVTEADCER
jgi:2-C-methyl-D-erythritol 2,4-cyclodiphosphate synthase